jgi:hypothetical protein
VHENKARCICKCVLQGRVDGVGASCIAPRHAYSTVQRPRPASDWAPDAVQPEMPTARHPAPAPRHAGVTSLQGIHLSFLCILVFDRYFLRDGVLRNSRGSLYLSQLWLIAANILPRLPNHHDISACLLATTRYCTPLRMACTTQYTSM